MTENKGLYIIKYIIRIYYIWSREETDSSQFYFEK